MLCEYHDVYPPWYRHRALLYGYHLVHLVLKVHPLYCTRSTTHLYGTDVVLWCYQKEEIQQYMDYLNAIRNYC